MEEKNNLVKDRVADLKNIPTLDNLWEDLATKVLKVTFKKLNGDTRVLTCTRSPTFIPVKMAESEVENATKNLVNVWDVEAKGWRSFHYDRVEKVEIL